MVNNRFTDAIFQVLICWMDNLGIVLLEERAYEIQNRLGVPK